MAIAVDASITIAWLLRESTLVDRDGFARKVRTDGAVVPAHWRLEVANGLLQSVRRNRLSSADVVSFLVALRELPIVTDRETDEHAWTVTLSLAERHTLTVYDAAYLELAIRRQLPLASLDGPLNEAAKAEGVEVIGA